jgi:hypothetical protein
MDWLANTPSPAKREGFFIASKEVGESYADPYKHC